MSHTKLRFEFLNAHGDTEVESMWAIKREEGLELDNIPFYAMEVALGDIVCGVEDEQGLLWYSHLIKPSGHSTVQIWFAREQDVPLVRAELKQMGCDSELSELPRLLAVDVPPHVPYGSIKAYLDVGKQRGDFEYQEACLGFL